MTGNLFTLTGLGRFRVKGTLTASPTATDAFELKRSTGLSARVGMGRTWSVDARLFISNDRRVRTWSEYERGRVWSKDAHPVSSRAGITGRVWSKDPRASGRFGGRLREGAVTFRSAADSLSLKPIDSLCSEGSES